jgi:hypothetical protein
MYLLSRKRQKKLTKTIQKSKCSLIKKQIYKHEKIETLINIIKSTYVQQHINPMHSNYLILKEYLNFNPVGIFTNSNYLI